MSSHFTCCGCWPSFMQGLPGTTKTGRTYRRAKYNEREYSIEFENLIEEEDFYAPAQHAVTEVERDLLSRRKFGELLQHENDLSREQDAKLKEREENARLEDEAYIQAKREASRVARQAMKKQINEKSKFPNMQKFDSVEFSKWLSEEKIDITSPELDVEDFESFLEKVRAKSAQSLEEEGKKKDAKVFEQTLSQGLAATKIAGDALNALQPVELHAVGMPTFNQSPDVEAHMEDVNYDSNFTEVEEDSELLNIPDVQIRSEDTVILSSQLPVSSTPLIVEPQATFEETFQESKNQLVDISHDASISIEQSTQPLVTQVDVEVEKTPETLVTFASDTLETLVTFTSDTSEAPAFDTMSIDSIPSTEMNQLPVDNSSEDLHILEMSSSIQTNTVHPPVMIDTDEQLIDISSPVNDEPQTIGIESQSSVIPVPNADEQCAFSFDNQSFESFSYEEVQIDTVNPVEELQELKSPPLLDPQVTTTTTELLATEQHNCVTSSEIVPIATVAIINTPRNVATNLKPVENGMDDLHAISNDIEVQSFKMVTPTTSELKPELNTNEILEDSLNDDDDFNDFEDEFVSSNSNAAFEDYLT